MSLSEKNPSLKAPPSPTWAYFQAGEAIYVAEGFAGEGFWQTALFILISEVHRQFPGQALRLLRNRIHTNEPSNEFTKGLVKVGAKRVKHWPLEAIPPGLRNAVWIRPTTTGQAISNDFPNWPIWARLLDENGQEVAMTVNQSSISKVFHAEVLLLQKWGKKIPKGYKIQVSHKPCQMCAGLIYESSMGHPEVSYENEITGRRSKITILDSMRTASK